MEEDFLLVCERKNKKFQKEKFAFRDRIGHPHSLLSAISGAGGRL